jgi:hypothetical protein
MFDVLLSWLTGRSRVRDKEPAPLAQYRVEARRLAASGTAAEVDAALGRASSIGAAPDALELELEMLRGRRDALRLADRIAREGLPAVETQHKAIGTDVCHLLVPATLVGRDGEDVSGKLLLTNRRLLFLGGHGLYLAWSSLQSVTPEARDLLVDTVHHDLHRLRCNTHGDAASAAVLAGALMRPRSTSR